MEHRIFPKTKDLCRKSLFHGKNLQVGSFLTFSGPSPGPPREASESSGTPGGALLASIFSLDRRVRSRTRVHSSGKSSGTSSAKLSRKTFLARFPGGYPGNLTGTTGSWAPEMDVPIKSEIDSQRVRKLGPGISTSLWCRYVGDECCELSSTPLGKEIGFSDSENVWDPRLQFAAQCSEP